MIDSHCHINFKSLKNILPSIIKDAKKNNVTSLLSINTDPDASIFKYSKFGIVEDCNKFIIDLIEEIKKTS